MNVQAIKEICNSGLPEETIEYMIITVLSSDEKIIPTIMKILERERSDKKDLLLDCNLLLSKAHLGLEKPEFNSEGFMQKEIRQFYRKYKGKIGHCFMNLEEEEKMLNEEDPKINGLNL